MSFPHTLVLSPPLPFQVQWGIPALPAAAAEWRSKVIKDDPVVHSNERGTITFATSGKDSRTTQVGRGEG